MARSASYYQQFDSDSLAADWLIRAGPVPALAGAVAAGIIISRYEVMGAWGFGLICLGALATALLFRGRGVKEIWFWFFLLTAWAALGALRYQQVYNNYPVNHIARLAGAEPRLATIEGVIISEPYISQSRGALAAFDRMHQPLTIFTLEARRALTCDGFAEICGVTQVVIAEPALNLGQGQRVRLDCWLVRYGGVKNPGQFDYEDTRRAQKNLTTCRVENSEAIEILSGAGLSLFERVRNSLRYYAGEALRDEYGSQREMSDTEAFLGALVLGQRYGLPEELNEKFVKTGTIHFLSVSGLHVGILVWFVLALCRLGRVQHRNEALLVLATLAVYLLIVPPRAPVLRASIMAVVFCLFLLSRYPWSGPGGVTQLAVAAVVLLLGRPLDLFNAGFQLSFVVVLALLVFVGPFLRGRIHWSTTDPLADKLAQAAREYYDSDLPWYRYAGKVLFVWVKGIVVVALVAWLVSMPLTAYHFHRVSLVAGLGSILLAPLIFVTLIMAFIKIIVGVVLGSGIGILTGAVDGLAGANIFVIDKLAGVPFASINTAAPSIYFIWVYYAILASMAYTIMRWGRVYVLQVRAAVLGLILFAVLLPIRGHEKGTLEVHCLAVGPGLATVVEMPDGKTLVYDAGSLMNFDVGNKIIAPFIRQRGINRIDGLFISHANIDHYNGVLDLADLIPVDKVYVTEYFIRAGESSSAVRFLLEGLAIRGIAVEAIGRGAEVMGDVEVLWPRAGLEYGCDDNDTSLVLRVAEKVLLTGDVELAGQVELMRETAADKLRAEVMVLPHHGATPDSLRALLAKVNADIMICSSGKLSESRQAKLAEIIQGTRFWHTYRDGAVSCKVQMQK